MTDGKCRFIDKCPMFSKFIDDFGLRVFQSTFCNSSNHAQCERFKIASTDRMPPADLLPNGRRLVLNEPGT